MLKILVTDKLAKEGLALLAGMDDVEVAVKTGISEDELHKAKELSKGRLLLRMEDTRSVSGWLGGQELLNRVIRTPDEIVELIEAVTLDDVARVARTLLDERKVSMALVGPFRSERRFARLLKL